LNVLLPFFQHPLPLANSWGKIIPVFLEIRFFFNRSVRLVIAFVVTIVALESIGPRHVWHAVIIVSRYVDATKSVVEKGLKISSVFLGAFLPTFEIESVL